MNQFKEAPNNPFDAPVPGQGLTDKPGNYPWEHPPQYTNTMEATEFVWDKLTEPQFAEQVIGMLDAGIQGGVKKFRISTQDLTNNTEMKSILDVKKNKTEFEKASKGVQAEIKKQPEQKGLMAAPQPKEEEMI